MNKNELKKLVNKIQKDKKKIKKYLKKYGNLNGLKGIDFVKPL